MQIIYYDYITTDFGLVTYWWSDTGVFLLTIGVDEFGNKGKQREFQNLTKRLSNYFSGSVEDFADIPVDLLGLTSFTQSVLTSCRLIKYGKTACYSEIADNIGRNKSARAVGAALAKNPIPIIIPCHRIVSKKGVGGFSVSFGVDAKIKLLELEGNIL